MIGMAIEFKHGEGVVSRFKNFHMYYKNNTKKISKYGKV
jgi:hypothetical protein